MPTSFIDFADLKARVTIHQVMTFLNLNLKQSGGQYRGACPVHGGGDRALVITPGHRRNDGTLGSFYCQAAKQGGDSIGLYSHCQGCSAKEAATAIARHFGISTDQGTGTVTGTVPVRAARKPDGPRPAFDAAAYADKLDPAHEALGGLGIAPDTLKGFKAGYASTGKLRGRLALPVADRQGNILCFVGRALKDEQPTLLWGTDSVDPKSLLFGWERAERGDVLYVAKDPLEVIRASESGISAVSFLGDITADGLQVLSLLLDELQIPSIDFL
jgi:DNA primase